MAQVLRWVFSPTLKRRWLKWVFSGPRGDELVLGGVMLPCEQGSCEKGYHALLANLCTIKSARKLGAHCTKGSKGTANCNVIVLIYW